MTVLMIRWRKYSTQSGLWKIPVLLPEPCDPWSRVWSRVFRRHQVTTYLIIPIRAIKVPITRYGRGKHLSVWAGNEGRKGDRDMVAVLLVISKRAVNNNITSPEPGNAHMGVSALVFTRWDQIPGSRRGPRALRRRCVRCGPKTLRNPGPIRSRRVIRRGMATSHEQNSQNKCYHRHHVLKMMGLRGGAKYKYRTLRTPSLLLSRAASKNSQ